LNTFADRTQFLFYMPELLMNSNERLNSLNDFARRFVDGESGNLLISEYKQYIASVSANDAMQVFDYLLVQGYPFEMVKRNVGKIINVFYKSLNSVSWKKPDAGHFLYYLMLENREVEKIMTAIKPIIKGIMKDDNLNSEEQFSQLHLLVSRLKEYDLHYIKKENILFPYLEKTFTQYRCLQLMWSFHDDFRRCLKALVNILMIDQPDRQLLNVELGKLFFVVLPLIFREEQIVFPVAIRAIPEETWAEMLEQSLETGWCYGVRPMLKNSRSTVDKALDGKINLGTGFLLPEQLILLLNNLPVDITFIDENDEVCYFSGAKHRIFPRSKAIIGRKVQNCHPPESVHIVNEIVESFRTGKKDFAEFWIQMKGRFIHIRYFALRSELGEYKGTIEVSQDVTEIRDLQGEKRLFESSMN